MSNLRHGREFVGEVESKVYNKHSFRCCSTLASNLSFSHIMAGRDAGSGYVTMQVDFPLPRRGRQERRAMVARRPLELASDAGPVLAEYRPTLTLTAALDRAV